jgi:fructose-bisphosphate aldolase class II
VSAIRHGFSSVMMDGSLKEDAKTPADYAYNAAITSEVANLAHMAGVSVEGELGCLGSLETGYGEAEDGHGAEGKLSRKMLLTDPDEAKRFVEETQVDALAVAIGTSHGAYKFTQKPTGDVLAMDVIEAIHARLPGTHIVMHGSSSVPQKLREMFTQFGGEMRETYGVPVKEIVRGIKMGSARSTSTPISGLQVQLSSAGLPFRTGPSSTLANSSSLRWLPCGISAGSALRPLVPQGTRPASSR